MFSGGISANSKAPHAAKQLIEFLSAPATTRFGGVSCMPKAWQSIESTMIVRLKDVIAITMAGSTASVVSSRTIRSASVIGAPDELVG